MAVIAVPILAACEGPQSALDPASEEASRLADLFWVMAAGAVVVWLIVAAVTVFVLVRRARLPEMWGSRLIWGGGVILPVVTLTILLAFGLDTLADLRPADPRSAGPAEAAPRAVHRIEVVGHTWWWRVRYHHPDFAEPIESANELRLPVGVPVEIALTSEDVIHAFWVPALGGKLDMIPGRTNRLVIEAGRAGVFRGQCAEYCGASHAHMAFIAEAMPPDEYDRWLRDQAKPFVPSQFEPDNRGLEIFLEAGCGACHQIRGTPASGRIGPDLTHVGGRHTIAAGLYPTNAGTIAGWTAAAQELKPAARMPSFNTLSGVELRTLGEFLARLE